MTSFKTFLLINGNMLNVMNSFYLVQARPWVMVPRQILTPRNIKIGYKNKICTEEYDNNRTLFLR